MKKALKAITYLTNLRLEEQLKIPTRIILVYLFWKVFHHFASIRGTQLNRLWTAAMELVGTGYAAITSFLITPFVQQTSAKGINIYLNSPAVYKVVWVQEHCLAIPAMVIFTATVAFYRGKPNQKAGFIMLGLAGIALINVARLFLLSLAWLYLSPYFFQMHHSLIYVAITYGFIFMMLRWWIKRSTTRVNAELISKPI